MAVAVVCWAADQSFADAIVVTKAMSATTIAEILVDEGQVRVKLEIGAPDLLAFQGILPAEIVAKLDTEVSTSDDRLKAFFREGFAIRADDGELLPGRVHALQARRRIVRDEITGEPLAEQPADAELVVVAELQYEMNGRPSKLSIQSPVNEDPTKSANIGFVAYHRGLPVNDFRYLSREATLELNWDDPWYSRFQNRNLWRRNAAPMSAFLYVEPYEVRKEIIIRPNDLQRFIDLGLTDMDVIPINRQADLKAQVGKFLREKNPVFIDGQERQCQLDRIHFVRRTLRRTGIVDPPEDLNVTSATLGVIFVYPIEKLPQDVTMKWQLFDDVIQDVPSSTSDEAGPMPATLTPEDPVLVWRNYLKNPTRHRLAEVAPAPVARRFSLPVMTLICAVALMPLSIVCSRRYRRSGSVFSATFLLWVALALIAAAAFPYARVSITNPFAAPPPLSDAQAEEILAGLLHNVYRAFDRRDPSLIYDQLARSIAGELLEQVYLDTRKTIEIENQGGLQIKVDDVTILKLQRRNGDLTPATYRVNWQVAGSVGHWGHVHTRVNTPSAEITMAPVDSSWKIVAMKMIPDWTNDLSSPGNVDDDLSPNPLKEG